MHFRLVLDPSAALSASFASQECGMHSWEAFFVLFVSRGCTELLLATLFSFPLIKDYPTSIRMPVYNLANQYVSITRGNLCNFDKMFFQTGGELTREFDAHYASLFKKPRHHIAIITALAKKKHGLLRDEILKSSKLPDNSDFTKALQELEQCGFIRKYSSIGKKTKDSIYQLIDNFTIFYFDFICENTNGDEHFWTSSVSTTVHYGWAGRAFERVCMQHIKQIKEELGFSGVVSSAHSWIWKGTKDPITGRTIQKGAQIDLLIDRNDDTINLCEMKYTNAPYVITEEEDSRIRNRKETFIRETGTEKTVLVTMITTFGLAPGGYSDDILCQLTMEDLFR